MSTTPCPQRHFPFRINFVSFYATYLRWLRHLSERLGYQNTLSIWKNTFGDYDDKFTMSILSSGWQKGDSDDTNQLEAKAEALICIWPPQNQSSGARFLKTLNLASLQPPSPLILLPDYQSPITNFQSPNKVPEAQRRGIT